MKQFGKLFTELDETNSTLRKVEALQRYFQTAESKDAAWALFFLMGNRLPRVVKSSQLREWVSEYAGYPLWLVEECYSTVGDLAETLALLLPQTNETQLKSGLSLADLVESYLIPLRENSDEEKKSTILQLWQGMDPDQRFLLNKILTGGFRVGVQRTLVSKALAKVAKLPPDILAHRLMGDWKPSSTAFKQLLEPEKGEAKSPTRPYPFFLASPLDSTEGLEPGLSLGDCTEWSAEWKWDGIRSQLIKRQGVISLWSRGEELLTDRFPELAEEFQRFPDGIVLDGEILAWKDGRPLPFNVLQQRIGRKNVTPAILKKAPVIFMIYDVLEWKGEDIRALDLPDRRSIAERFLFTPSDAPTDFGATSRYRLSESVSFSSWEDLRLLLNESRDRGVEGFVLKRKRSPYRTGRVKGDWWKWKIDPLTIDAVMIYAQSGHGRRAGLFTDYTFALKSGDDLVPVAKAYSGLSDKEFRELDRWIKSNTIERFGPVRSVPPHQVFEIGFEGVNRSSRHKSGFALRFPRMLRWRKDKPNSEIDSLESLEKWLPASESS